MKKKIIIIIISILLLISIIGIIHYKNIYDKNLVNVDDIVTDSKFENITYNQVEELNEDILGILTIDKIGLKATVKEGSNKEILENYIGHIENTSTYDGNVVLAGHNRGNQYSYFARINELEKGDIITYQTKFYTRNYKVDNIQTILETDCSLLQDTKENKITLITCVPNKRVQRLCVQATEVVENVETNL